MSSPRAPERGTADEAGGAPEAALWEARFFFERLPAGLETRALRAILGEPRMLQDDDLYVLGAGPAVNLKLRRRRNCVKLKLLLGADGEFERWLEVLEAPLPASHALCERLVHQLALPALASLAGAGDVDEARARLERLLPDESLVRVRKERDLFRAPGGARVEVARVAFPSVSLATVNFEGPDLAAARELRARLLPVPPAPPESYVRACAQHGVARLP